MSSRTCAGCRTSFARVVLSVQRNSPQTANSLSALAKFIGRILDVSLYSLYTSNRRMVCMVPRFGDAVGPHGVQGVQRHRVEPGAGIALENAGDHRLHHP